jgi:hypothetical protein
MLILGLNISTPIKLRFDWDEVQRALDINQV